MSQVCVAELTPLSSCQSYKGTSVDSSHCHFGTTEMLSLHRSDTLPPKLLGHLTDGGCADSVGPFLLRLSGPGFAHYAPGPETSVWPAAQTLYPSEWAETCSMSYSGLLLKDQEKHSPCAFSGLHLIGQPFRFHPFTSHLTLGLSCGFWFTPSLCFHEIQTKKENLIDNVSEQNQNYVRSCFIHCGSILCRSFCIFWSFLVFLLMFLPVVLSCPFCISVNVCGACVLAK